MKLNKKILYKENIIQNFKLKAKKRPLQKINILDIGCGGGLLSEPMTRLGASVTGIDASDKNINMPVKLMTQPSHQMLLLLKTLLICEVLSLFYDL